MTRKRRSTTTTKTAIVKKKSLPSKSSEEVPIHVEKNELEHDEKWKILDESYLTSAKSSQEVAKRLKDVHDILKDIANQSRIQEVRNVAHGLIEEQIMESKEKHVRLLAACCLVDVLRICAPEAPYSNHDLIDVFKLIITQLRGLEQSASDDPLYVRYFYILESVATVKSCILLVGLDHLEHENPDSDEQLLVELFQCLFGIIHEDHSIKVESHILTIMQSCIEEGEMVSQQLLDTILSQLIPSTRSSSRAYGIALQLIELTSHHLESFISQFFNRVLVDGGSVQSELKDDIGTLIYEVHKADPSLLLYVIPNVSMQLQVDVLKTRQDAVALMGRLFSSRHADYGNQYMKTFLEFLGRFNDVNKEIRLQMIQIGGILASRKPDLAHLIIKELARRLVDHEFQIRRAALNELCDAIATLSINNIDESILVAIGERAKDKKVVIRKEAMTGLAQIYNKFTFTTTTTTSSSSSSTTTTTTTDTKLDWIPGHILKCYAYPEHELRLRVIKLFEEIIIPKQESSQVRVKLLISLYQDLDKNAKEALRRILLDKKQLKVAVEGFLDLISNKKDKKDDLNHYLKLIEEQVPSMEDPSIAKDFLATCSKWKEKNTLFGHWKCLSDSTSSMESIKEAKQSLNKMFQGNSPLGKWMKEFSLYLSMGILHKENLSMLFQDVKTTKNSSPSRKSSILDLLLLFSEVYPTMFLESMDDLMDLITFKDVAISTTTSKILGQLTKIPSLAKENPPPHLDLVVISKEQQKKFMSLATKGDVNCAKSSVEILVRTSTKEKLEELFDLLIKQMTLKNNNHNHHSLLLTTIHSIGTLAKCPSKLVVTTDRLDKVEEFIYNEIFQLQHDKKKNTSRKAVENNKLLSLKIASIRMLVNFSYYGIMEKKKRNELDEEMEKKQALRLLDCLFEMLNSDSCSSGSGSQLRSCAAFGILKLVRTSFYDSLVSVAHWNRLCYMTQDPSVSIRKEMIDKIYKGVVKYQLSHKYLCALVLSATEPNDTNKKAAKIGLVNCLKHMKHLHEVYCTNGSEKAVLMMPEYAVPYALHLLAHSPNDSIDEHSLRHYLHFLFDPLISIYGADADNIAFLLQILDQLSHCQDTMESTTEAITLSKIIENAVVVIKKKIKIQSHLKAYPGKIYLPTNLFHSTPEHQSVSSESVVERTILEVREKVSKRKSNGTPRVSLSKVSRKKNRHSSPQESSPQEIKKKIVTTQPSRRLPTRNARSSISMADLSGSEVDEIEVEEEEELVERSYDRTSNKTSVEIASDEEKPEGSSSDEERMQTFRTSRRRT